MKSISLKDKKILVTGGHGFLGSRVVEELIRLGVPKKNITAPRSSECDFRIIDNCRNAVKNKDIVIHCAATVGGIEYNKNHPGTIFYNNISMGVNLMEAAREAHIQKFVMVGTICEYPKHTPIPFKEKNLWDGYPEESNGAYGIAKKAILVQGQAYGQEFNLNVVHLLLENLYGPGDNFDPKSSHVIPALIKKVAEAKINNTPVSVWGTGKATREFLYVDDAARAIVLATQKYNSSEPINIGSGMEISIKNLIKLIVDIMGYKDKIIWDKTKPDGQLRRYIDISRAKKEFRFQAHIPFEKGLKKTIEWYRKNG